MTCGVVAVDYHRKYYDDVTPENRDLEHGQSVCASCAHSEFTWDFLTEQSVRNVHWRTLRTKLSKKLFRIQMLRAIYQRGVHLRSSPSK